MGVREEAPAFHEARDTVTDSPPSMPKVPKPGIGEMIKELLVDQLRDILSVAEAGQKALPKMVKAAHSQQLQQLFERRIWRRPKPRWRGWRMLGILAASSRERRRARA